MKLRLKQFLWANPSSHTVLSVEDQIIGIEPTLKIPGVTLDKDLSSKPHVDMMLKKAYA